MYSSEYTVKAFVFKWLNNPMVLDFSGTSQQVVERFIYQAVDHEANRKVAEKFGTIITQVKVFPTDSGWMIQDRFTKRPLHKGLKNKQEVDELCRKCNYVA